ncbi:MAG: acetoacetate--CoA ligase, partial [Mesorhizobium sp.]
MAADTPLWTPTQERIDAAPLTAFMKAAAAKVGEAFSSYAELHRWSIEHREAFWSLVWDFCGLVGDRGERGLIDGERMPG